ncbi:MAG: Dam family site-specific DNA-(adenine-N6)-methyltransferase [Dehalococcoidia bacterium]|nr:Dam family site-specific DNA-(adenine-N6)-methyltransferase [Dehalococcoidia bacterium]
MAAPAASASADLAPLRPPLKWAGGKRWLVPHLRSIWQPYQRRRLVEPLCGGLAVALGLRPGRALLNDLNPHNMNFYAWLKRGLVIAPEIDMENESELYYTQRRRFNQLIDLGESDSQAAAELFYYLNRTGYNGLCRFNQSGQYNVPFGKHATINYQRDFRPYAEAMAGWELSVGDFEAIPLRPDDFIYADPPYDVEFTQYSAKSFGWQEQERLAQWLSAHPGPVVLSNQKTQRVVDLYGSLGFEMTFESAPRMISSNGDRTPAIEVIATRNLR